MRESAITQLEILGEAGGELDFAKQISAPYPLQVVLDVIGVPRADQPQMLRLTQWLFSWADPELGRPGTDPSHPEQQPKTWKIAHRKNKRHGGLRQWLSRRLN